MRVIPFNIPSDDLNISPVDGYKFSICRSKQNLQLLSCCNGVLYCIYNYIIKTDGQNFVETKVYGDSGQLVNMFQHLYKTKVTTSKINEDRVCEKRQRLSKTTWLHNQSK